MGKKHKKKQVVVTPSFESPVCPTCGFANRLVEESGGDDPMYECTRCWIRFMIEDSRVETEDEDDDTLAASNINSGVAARTFDVEIKGLKCAICRGKNGKGEDGKLCMVCKPKKDSKEYQTDPIFGECEELTDGVAKRS